MSTRTSADDHEREQLREFVLATGGTIEGLDSTLEVIAWIKARKAQAKSKH